MSGDQSPGVSDTEAVRTSSPMTDYCAQLQQWMWQYYWSWGAVPAAFAFPYTLNYPPIVGAQQWFDAGNCNIHPYPFYPLPVAGPSSYGVVGSTEQAATTATGDRATPQQDGVTVQAGREYKIPSPLQRFLAETVDFFILFCVKATIVLWIMHMSGMKDITKFITQFIVEEIDENTSIEDLQKMMAVALAYRVLVCVYETLCIWGAGGATPGKFLLGLRVVTCDTSTVVRPNRVFVVPATNVSLSASAVRALNKNFSIAFLFPIFITLLFFQHNRTVYDMVAGTIVVQRRSGR